MKKKVLVALPDNSEVKNTFLPEDLREYLAEHFDVVYNTSTKNMSKAELGEAIKDVDAVMTGWGNAKFDEESLAGNTRLKMIAHTGGTVASYVEDVAYDMGIKVISGNLLYAESVAEGTIAYMLMAQRRLPEYVYNVRNGGWRMPAGEDVWESLMDKEVGIVGLGTISRFLIPMLHALRCKIRLYSHYDPDPVFMKQNGVTRCGLNEVFEKSDIISVHSALNAENRGLIGKEQFELIKDGALFLNTSRGAVLDQDALIAELQKKRFRAVLDVYVKEPLEEDSPLRSLPNVYCIPHKAGPTLDRRAFITKAVIDDMIRFFDGEEFLTLEITKEMAKRMTKM
ncbi:MAG: hydroxyacid dehydrogenase [Clostridia bacterium]|nr:hydroxyacid dehydrogenase [Clostridia bacterium]